MKSSILEVIDKFVQGACGVAVKTITNSYGSFVSIEWGGTHLETLPSGVTIQVTPFATQMWRPE